jgi:biopolymer transport protein ExbD
MRFKRLKRRTGLTKGHLDVAMKVPLIDVMFNLLIFFMLTSNYVLQPGIRVNLPKAISSEVIRSENLVVTLSGQDLLFLNDQPTTIQQLVPQIRQAAQDNKTVLLRADASASLGRVVEIWDLCRESGIPQINIATNQKSGELLS